MEKEYFSFFEKSLKEHTQKHFQSKNFAIKLYPRMLTMSEHSIDNLETYKLKIITNVSYVTNIKKYDTIFYLTRNLLDSVCSWAYGNHIDYFNFRDKEMLELKLNQFPKLTINIENDSLLKFYLMESAILTHWKSYLLHNNIKFTELDYNQIPNYVNDNCPSIQSKTIDSKLNYQEIILNYSELQGFIDHFYKVCLEKTQDLIFT